MKKCLEVFVLIFCFFHFAVGQYDGDQIFDESYIHEIRITTELSIDQLYNVFAPELLSGSYTYTMSDLVIDGTTIDSVGIRVKGGISSFDPKRPLKIDFNEFVSGKQYDGLKKLNLHQGNMDPSFMREALAYGLFRNAGVKIVRTSFAKVYYNGTYEGIYTLVGQVDADFIQRNFASKKGVLYKTDPASDGLEVKYEDENLLPYNDFVSEINQIPIALLHERLPDYLDVESFFRFIATEIFITAVDGPLTDDINYYIYYEPKSARYIYIPWDYNLSFYGGKRHKILQDGANFIFEKIKQNTVLRDRYVGVFCDLLQYNFEENRIRDIIGVYEGLLSEDVSDDPYQSGDFDQSILFLQNLISQRIQELTAEMNSSFTPCGPLASPFNSSGLVINEIVASNDPLSGVTDPAGGSADWIELFNNSSSEISLEGFYLSNDVDLLKHWRFPKDAAIAPKNYLIIWADRDVEEDGLHADFKLNKTLGELYLSFENGDIIDSLNFDNQSTNVGFARVPNGIGPFMTQATSFNTSNDIITSMETATKETTWSVAPNPARENPIVRVYSVNASSVQIQLSNMQGSILWQTQCELLSGDSEIALPSDQWVSGIYGLILIDSTTGERSSRRLVIH